MTNENGHQKSVKPLSARNQACLFVFFFFLFAVLLNAKSMLRSAENMPFDNPTRNLCIKILTPISKISQVLYTNQIRSQAEKIEREYLE